MIVTWWVCEVGSGLLALVFLQLWTQTSSGAAARLFAVALGVALGLLVVRL